MASTRASLASDVEELADGLSTALASGKPELVEVKVAPGMALT